MKKVIVLLTALATIISCTGCGKENTAEQDAPISDTSSVEVEPTLYSVGDAFSKVFDTLGYDSTKTASENREAIDTSLAQYGLSLNSIKESLSGDTNTNPTITAILSLGGINNSEVDWSTTSTFMSLPIFGDDPTAQILSSNDRELFLDTIKQNGASSYADVLAYIPVESEIDTSIMTTLLNPEACENFLNREIANLKYVNDYTVQYKPGNGFEFYELVYFNGIRTASYYPSLVKEDGSPLYMRRTISNSSEFELWQAYTIYYLLMLEDKFSVSSAEGVIDNTVNGLSMWWSLGASKTLLFTISDAGNIAISISTDDRYVEYNGSQIADEPESAITYACLNLSQVNILQLEYGLDETSIWDIDILCSEATEQPVYPTDRDVKLIAAEYLNRGNTYRSNFKAYATIAKILDPSIDMSLYEKWYDKIPDEKLYAGADECILQTSYAIRHTPSKRLKLVPFTVANITDRNIIADYTSITGETAIGAAVTALGGDTTLWSAVTTHLAANGISAFTTLNSLGADGIQEIITAVPYFTAEEQAVLLGAVDN